jgi:hypothetical protein
MARIEEAWVWGSKRIIPWYIYSRRFFIERWWFDYEKGELTYLIPRHG